MTEITTAAELDALPPLQLMVLEVLAARYRLGEVLWTFTAHTSTVRAIRALEAAGLVTGVGGIVPRTIRASLTPSGVAAATSPTYRVPDQPQRVQPSREDVARALAAANDTVWDFDPKNPDDVYLRDADAVLALFAAQPTVAQIKAEALREAADAMEATAMTRALVQSGTAAAWFLRSRAGWVADRVERESRP